MANNFIPSGPLGDFYKGAMSPPNRLPNGTLVPAQIYGQPSSVQQIYSGIIPGANQGPTTRPVSVITVDARGNQTGNAFAPTTAEAMQESRASEYAYPRLPSETYAVDPSQQQAAAYIPSSSIQADGNYGQGYAPMPGYASPTPAVTAIDAATQPSSILPQFSMPSIPSVSAIIADASNGLGTASNYVQQKLGEAQAAAPGVISNMASSIIPQMLQTVGGRSLAFNTLLGVNRQHPITGQGFGNASNAADGSPLSGLLRKNGGGLGENALVPTNSRWETGY